MIAAMTGNDSFNAWPSGTDPLPQPMILWVDGVGGFLILAGRRWTIGRTDSTGGPQISIRGDLPRSAGAIQRNGSDYVLKPAERNPDEASASRRPVPLSHGKRLSVGGSVAIGFSRPHPLSASARIDLASRHRFEPACDGVILLADTCVLGPSSAAHILCRHFAGDVVLFTSGTDLRIRCDRPFEIDGKEAQGKPIFSPGQRVEGEDFAMALEAAQVPTARNIQLHPG